MRGWNTVGKPFEVNGMSVQEERRGRKRRFRLRTTAGVHVVMSEDELLDLAEALDRAADYVEGVA